MKTVKNYLIIGLLFFAFSAFTVHKFYVSIYQIHYAPEKKMLQITARIFFDDLNDVLFRKYKQKTFLGEKNESSLDIELMKKYLSENISIKVNGKLLKLNYLSREFESNVIICYLNCKNIPKIKTLEVQNTALFDLVSDQQNIIQASVSGQKQNLLLTSDQKNGILKFD